MPDLLFFLLLGHFIGDYALQTDRMVKSKGTSALALSWHVLIYTLTIAVFWWLGRMLNGERGFFGLTEWLILAGLYVEHWLQDYYKSVHSNGSQQAYYIDQALHLGVLYLIRIVV